MDVTVHVPVTVVKYSEIPRVGSTIPSSAEKTEYSCVVMPETV